MDYEAIKNRKQYLNYLNIEHTMSVCDNQITTLIIIIIKLYFNRTIIDH